MAPGGLLLALTLLMGTPAAVRASVVVDLDRGMLIWRNDGDPGIVLLREGRQRRWRQEAIQANPLAGADRLRFPACLPGLPAEEGGCLAPEHPAGAPGLEGRTPLEAPEKDLYEGIWERLPPERSPQEQALVIAMERAAEELGRGLSFRESRRVFRPVEQALRNAADAASPSALVVRAERARQLFAVLQDLWRQKIDFASRDVNIPCDRLRNFEQRFNRTAGEDRVRLTVLRPRGICLFCGNVCTQQSADLLLEQMKAGVVEALQPPPSP